MAEEDLIFGKNRHFFGGIEPSNMLTFRATKDTSSGNFKVRIEAQLPNDTVIDGQTLCTVAGAIIRRKTTNYPSDEFDGIEIANITESTTIYDTDVDNETYYYAAFPYTTQGVYNRNPINRAKVRKHDYLFGFDLDENDSNPSTRVTYPSDVDNVGFAPAAMNFSTDVFNYGGWPSTPGEKFMPKPCMLTYAGVVDHYLDPNDYTKKEDGTPSSVADTAFEGNAMMEWPKIFTKRWIDANGIYHFRCCDIALDNDYECWCNYDKNNNQIDHFYTPIYFGSNISGKLRSISGQSNSVSTTADTEITYAKANGDAWYTEVLADRLLIQDLLVMMAKSTELQTVFGYGRCSSSNSSAIGQGTMNTKGLFWGSNGQTSGVKVFGMENWWGNLWRRIAGWINDNGTQKVKITRGTRDGSTATDYNTTGSGYISVSGATPSGTSGGYISSMKTEVYGRLPVTASGSNSTYESDGLYFNNSGVYYAAVGGFWHDALLGGPFCAYLSHSASFSGPSIGAALSCKPLA